MDARPNDTPRATNSVLIECIFRVCADEGVWREGADVVAPDVGA